MADEVIAQAVGRGCALLRVGDPLDKNTDVGAINSRRAARAHRGARRRRRGARARCGARSPATLPERGYWFAPTIFTDVAPAHRIAVEEIFGPVRVGADLPHARPRRSRRPTTRPTAWPRASGPTRARRPSRSPARCRPASSGRTPTTSSTRRPPSAATRRSGFGREGGPAGLRPYLRRVMSQRSRVRKTYKLYVGGAFVRSESGRYDRALSADDEHVANVPRALAQGRARRGRAPRARRPARGRRAPPTTAARSSTAPPRRWSRAATRSAEAATRLARAPIDVARALRGLDRQAARRAGRRQPGRRAVPVLLAARADRRRRRGRARRAAAARASSPRSRPRWRRATRSSRSSPSAGRCRRSTSARSLGVSDVPGGVVNLLSGRRDELAPALGAHRDVNAIVDAAGDAELAAELDEPRRRDRQARAPRRAAASYEAATDDALARLEARDRAQDGLAPDRGLSAAR